MLLRFPILRFTLPKILLPRSLGEAGLGTGAFLQTKKNLTSKCDYVETPKTTCHQKSDNESTRSTLSDGRKRIVVGITGATGIEIAVRVLQFLKEANVETHLIISKWGIATMKYETDYGVSDLGKYADKIYQTRDISAPISSGSFRHDGMIVVPCSMKSLAAIRTGYTEDLLIRAADVTLKEGRKLLLAVRETPLSKIHLENMLALADMGVVIFPPVPAFYTRPTCLDNIFNQTAGRILDQFDIDVRHFPRWGGFERK